MINRLTLKGIFVAIALAAPAGAASAQSAEGLWRTEPGKTGAWLEVRIAPCGGALCGTVAAQHGAKTNLVGRQLIAGMRPDGAGRWSGGTIWAPDDDKTYRSRMSLAGNALKVEGCVLVICRGQTWTRLE